MFKQNKMIWVYTVFNWVNNSSCYSTVSAAGREGSRFDPWVNQGPVSGVYTLSLCIPGFHPGASVFSHNPKTCKLARLATLKSLSRRVCKCFCLGVSPAFDCTLLLEVKRNWLQLPSGPAMDKTPAANCSSSLFVLWNSLATVESHLQWNGPSKVLWQFHFNGERQNINQ